MAGLGYSFFIFNFGYFVNASLRFINKIRSKNFFIINRLLKVKYIWKLKHPVELEPIIIYIQTCNIFVVFIACKNREIVNLFFEGNGIFAKDHWNSLNVTGTCFVDHRIHGEKTKSKIVFVWVEEPTQELINHELYHAVERIKFESFDLLQKHEEYYTRLYTQLSTVILGCYNKEVQAEIIKIAEDEIQRKNELINAIKTQSVLPQFKARHIVNLLPEKYFKVKLNNEVF